MKRKLAVFILSGMMAVSLAACSADSSSQEENKSVQTEEPENSGDVQTTDKESSEAENPEETEISEGSSTQSSGSRILIAYFSMPEDIDISGIDADAGASVVVRDGEALGNMQYMAQTIQDTVGGDLFRIETEGKYPLEHDALVDEAADEQDAEVRPELSSHIENLDQYGTILLGYPIWWGDMPQALYTFLEEYDFSGKTVIPFCAHGGSGFSGTERTIAELQPKADVSKDGLCVSRNDVADGADDVAEWAAGLGIIE